MKAILQVLLDDVVAFMNPDPEDRWAGDRLPLLNSDDFYDQFNK